MMKVTIAPFKSEPIGVCAAPLVSKTNKEDTQKNPFIYWGIYVDDKYISYTSSKELAEKTKTWMEKWFEGKL